MPRSYKPFADLLEPFQHEGVVAQVGLGELLGEAEDDNDGKVALVCLADGVFEGMVALDPLGGLHPIEDVAAVLDAPAVERLDARGMDHRRYAVTLIVDPTDVFPPADHLADESLGAGERRCPCVAPGLLDGANHVPRVEKFQVHRRGEPRVVEPGLTCPQGVLKGAEKKKPVRHEVLQGLCRLPRGDGPVEVPQAPRVVGESFLHQVDGLPRDRVGQERHRGGDLSRPALREGSPVVGIVIPSAALGPIPVHQKVRFTPHLAVEELHPQLFSAPGEAFEVFMRGKEVAVLPDLEIDSRLLGRRLEVFAHSPLARLDDDELSRCKAPGGGLELERKAPTVFRVIELAVVDGNPFAFQGRSEVSHGRKEQDDAGLVGWDMAGLAGRLGHPDGILPGGETVEGGRAPVELIAQDEDQVPDRLRGRSVTGGTSFFHGSPSASSRLKKRAFRCTEVPRVPFPHPD